MRTEKPWGYEELLSHNDKYAFKKIVVGDGQRLSLQYHNEKRETWYIQSGIGMVVLGETEFNVEPNMVIDIPVGMTHRVTARSGEIVIIEASSPELDDVVRIRDDYGRT